MADRLEAVVDVAAFQRNVRSLVALVAPSQVMVAVKANAYGHGMVELARAAVGAGASSLAVLEVPAALELRDEGITVPLFAWLHSRSTDFAAAGRAGIDLGISASWQLDAIRKTRSGTRVHLKVDTGLSRNGATREDWPALVISALEAQSTGDITVAAIWSHLADASPDEDALALARLRNAVSLAGGLGLHPPLIHLAASSAGIREPEARLDLVRFGIAAYGISPFDDTDGRGLGLEPVLSLRSTVVETTDASARVAGGYADGILPQAAGSADVVLGGIRRRVLSIDVDSMLVDVAGANVGDEVAVLGDGGAVAEEWASWAGTIGDEVVAGITPRVPRLYRHS